MTASKVRADYEQLAQIAQVFCQQSETTQQVLRALQNDVNTLQRGDWVGKGAEAFYAEMNTAVLPAMKRVVGALSEASNTTQRISRIMKQAEDHSAALFRPVGAEDWPTGGEY